MSLISFSKPSDADILQRVVEKNTFVSFVDKGSVLQNVKETIYIRTVRIRDDKKEVLKKIIFVKKGIKWFFKTVEPIIPFNNSAIELKKLVS